MAAEIPKETETVVRSGIHNLGGDSFVEDAILGRAREVSLTSNGVEMFLDPLGKYKLILDFNNKTAVVEVVPFRGGEPVIINLFGVNKIKADPLWEAKEASLVFQGDYDRQLIIMPGRVFAKKAYPHEVI